METFSIVLLLLAWSGQLYSWYSLGDLRLPCQKDGATGGAGSGAGLSRTTTSATSVKNPLAQYAPHEPELFPPQAEQKAQHIFCGGRSRGRPVAPQAIKRRQYQATIFGATCVYLFLGALFYRFHDTEQYPTVAQALYFSVVTCTTIGYGENTPAYASTKIFTIAYSLGGIVLIGVFMIEMGDIFITASEVPTAAFLRRVVLKFFPGIFPVRKQSSFPHSIVKPQILRLYTRERLRALMANVALRRGSRGRCGRSTA